MSSLNNSLTFLKSKNFPLVLKIGEAILGIPEDELGDEFVREVDRIILTFEDFLQFEVKKLLFLFNSTLTSFFIFFSFKKYTKMTIENRERYVKKWMNSRIGLLRTGYVTLKAICAWAYYSSTKSWDEMNFPGETIGREHLTPTLLFGKEPYNWEDQK